MSTILRIVVTLGLLLGLVAVVGTTAAGPQAAPDAGGVYGTVFFDANANGAWDMGEPVVADVSVSIRDVATGGAAYSASTLTGPDGTYAFEELDPGTYLVAETDLIGYVSTTDNTREVYVGEAPVTGIDFGDTVPVTLRGTVFEDRNSNGSQQPDEPAISGVFVQVFADLNADALVEEGEPLAGGTYNNADGTYAVRGLMPGRYLLRSTPPPGYGGPTEYPLLLISSPLAGGAYVYRNVPLVATSPEPASLVGQVWNDRDGDEQRDDDEPPLAGVRLTLYADLNGNGAADPGEPPVGAATTDAAGLCRWDGLEAGAYVLDVDPVTVPAGWVTSHSPAVLAFQLLPGEARTVYLGFYDPLTVAPMRVAEWKKELHQVGKPHYTPAELDGFIATANGSRVFPELVAVPDALDQPARDEEQRARKEYAALRLNLASGRLLAKTPVNLPELTPATTVGAAADEIEGLLYPPATQPDSEYRRIRDLAESLNKGKGIGYGAQGSSKLAQATYKSGDVTVALKATGGGAVDAHLADGAIRLRKWSPGSLDGETNIFAPQLRVKILVFYDGGILEAVQILPDGREASLGQAVPTVWGKNVNATYTFDLWRVSTLGELTGTELRLYVRDPDNDPGSKEHVKVDFVEVTFQY